MREEHEIQTIKNAIGNPYVQNPKDAPLCHEREAWALLQQAVGKFSDDFMEDREQPPIQEEREEL